MSKAKFIKANNKLQKKGKKLASMLAILGVVGFGTGYFYGTSHLTDDKIKNEPVVKNIEKTESNNTEVKETNNESVTETDLVNASTDLTNKLNKLECNVNRKDVLYFISLINIEEIENNNSLLADKIFKSETYDNIKNSFTNVVNELYKANVDYETPINLTPYLFNEKDKEINESVQLITTFVDTNVIEDNKEEVNNIIIDDFIKPVYNLNDGYLNYEGRRITDKPSLGLLYLFQNYNSDVIKSRGYEMLNDNTLKVLNKMKNETDCNEGLKNLYNLSNQKTK